jgi:shikimate dehydrogenase
MPLYGLIGYPLTHSFSKKYFTEKFEREKIDDCSYELFPMVSLDELPKLISSHPLLAGLNVTIPYKQKVLSMLDDREAIPAKVDACNCIRIQPGRLTGFNTDIIGFEKSLQPLLKPHHTHALVLGNGGASAAVQYVLQQLGITYRVVSRAIHGNSSLTYTELDRNILEQHTLIINTTPLGMHPHTDTCPELPYQYLSHKHLLYDLVYNPTKTLFLQKGEERGAAIKNGEEMLILQAEESWRIWNS